MNFRQMRHRLTFQVPMTVPDGMGGRSVDWVDEFTTWGSIRPARAQEIFTAQQIEHEITHEIKMRYRTGISPQMRIVFEGRVFDITSLLNTVEADKELRIMVREVKDDDTD